MNQEDASHADRNADAAAAPRVAARAGRRGWLPVGVALLTAAIVLFIQFGTEVHQQRRNELSWTASGVGLALVGIWFFALSGLSGRLRRNVAAAAALIVIATAGTLRIDDVDGNLVPRSISWRCSPKHDESLAPLQVSPASAAATDPGPPPDGMHDYPQFLGPNRDAVTTGLRLARDWSAQPPKEVWRREIGAGWSAFAVRGRRAVTQEQRGPLEMVVCYDALTGRPLWKHEDEARFDTKLGGIGPRATPTINGGRVYTLGATGIFNCLDLKTGKRLWSVNVLDDNAVTAPQWGMACSPLVLDEKVIVTAGGDRDAALVAYDRETGKRIWAKGASAISYASPFIAEVHGRPHIIILNHENVTGHDSQTGEPLWSFAWAGHTPKAPQPVPAGENRFVVSSGYAVGCALFEVVRDDQGRFATRERWKTPRMRSKLSNLVVRDGYIYGLNDGLLACLELETGALAWRGQEYGHGQIILVDDLLLITAEDGRLVLVEAQPRGFIEVATFEAMRHKTWNHAALAGKYLLMRNDHEAACFELPILAVENTVP